jgi:hypothetical protein
MFQSVEIFSIPLLNLGLLLDTRKLIECLTGLLLDGPQEVVRVDDAEHAVVFIENDDFTLRVGPEQFDTLRVGLFASNRGSGDRYSVMTVGPWPARARIWPGNSSNTSSPSVTKTVGTRLVRALWRRTSRVTASNPWFLPTVTYSRYIIPAALSGPSFRGNSIRSCRSTSS